MPGLSRRQWFLLAILAACLAGAPGVGLGGERESFRVVVLPDTQGYAESFPDGYLAQTEWIKREAQAQNIKFVIHLGDVVQHVSAKKEWRVADRAHRALDGVVPYSMLPGNHDMRPDDTSPKLRDTTMYNTFFPPKRFENFDYYGGNEDGTNDNNYCLFSAAGMKFLVLSLEFNPNDATLDWAGKIVDANPDCRVILATHCYLGRDARREMGDRIWERLVRNRPRIFLILCGHVLGVNHYTRPNDAGRPVHEILADYQGLPNGGDGWLRVLHFLPGENRIDVETFSPTLNRHDRTPAQQFTLPYNMSPAASEGEREPQMNTDEHR
ncbi:MAG: metallophosphoesterase [Pirellulales bacterium]|nr:metallophosphoesterase [Pirellulales bacterium]